MANSYENLIFKALFLLQEHPQRFADYQNELQDLSRNLPDDLVGAANAFTRWCKTHPELYALLLEMPHVEAGQIRGMRGESGKIPKYDPTRDKVEIVNQLRDSLLSPPPQKSETPPNNGPSSPSA